MRLLLFILFWFPVLSQAQDLVSESELLANLKVLSSDSLQGRRTGTPGNAAARAFIKNKFLQHKLQPLGNSYELPFEFETRNKEKVSGVNVAGLIKGRTDSYLVISAHYDHLGVRNEKIYNGTDDNASGTSALLAVAAYFSKHPPEHNLILVAFDAEEMGLQGARAFVANPPVALEKIVVNINMDMVARADKGELVACGTFFYPQLKPFLVGAATEKVKLVLGHDDPDVYKGQDNWVNSSDHGPFHRAKIPFIYFGVEDHKDYHQPTDDFELVDPKIYAACVQLIIQATSRIDKGLKP
ncbi:MAG: M28 family peptidase [Cyclobacteriaceae bacterium]|nr:M28 family peptidase [Cyclobacteriaceae bacterium]